MALGGGNWAAQNKVLPGAYINFVSVDNANAQLAERGIVALPVSMDWGACNVVQEVTYSQFINDSTKLFGYSYTHDKLKNLREVFRHATKVLAYRMTNGAVKATNTYATAKYEGVRGNDITIVIGANTENSSLYDVATKLDGKTVDLQTVAGSSALKPNDFVEFKASASLTETAGTPLTGGTNGSAIEIAQHTAFLAALEAYSFNVLACPAVTAEAVAQYVAYTKRMRDERGCKFQVVVYKVAGVSAPDHEGVIQIVNTPEEATGADASLVYWVAGAEAGCAINRSCTNMLYDGEYQIAVPHTQAQLEECIKAGELVMHRVGNGIRVLMDINSLVTYTEEKGDIFADNQVVRVIDQQGNDIASLFNEKYLGAILNNDSGRTSFWNDVVTLHQGYAQMGAIENFSSDDIEVAKGEGKKTIVVGASITVAGTMTKLYMTTVVQ
ncbi:MAG: phage tail sheath family protein [Clostridiales bacterium]|nr:phage tail sheath family protein [Clostridiales bacterium]